MLIQFKVKEGVNVEWANKAIQRYLNGDIDLSFFDYIEVANGQ